MIGNYSLSLAMIMKNEAEVIARCLDSVKDVVDEIVLVDTGSTDDTIEIAKRYTNKIYKFKWIDDFSAARNFSFEKCTGDFILWCFHPDTKVHTKKGLVPISKIKVGQEVLTHTGQYKKVTKIYVQDYEGTLIKGKTHLSDEEFIVTPNHELYGVKAYKCKTGIKFCTPDCKKQWSKRYLKKYGKISRQCKQGYKNYDFSFNSIEKYEVGDILAYPRRKQDIFEPVFESIPRAKSHCKYVLPDEVEVTTDLMKLVGYYVAEVTYSKGSFSFCFHANETFFHDDVFYLMDKIFGIKGKKYIKGNRCNITFCSTRLASFFYNVLSGEQPTRCLPSKWLGLSDEHLKQFLKGYYRGDGGVNSDSFAMTTSSPILVYQLREILSRFGMCPHIRPYKAKKAWKVCIGGQQKGVFEECVNEKHPRPGPRFKNKYFYADDSYIYTQITSLKREKYKGQIYNLEVEDDHSYDVDYSISHNCDCDDVFYPEDAQKIKNLDLSDKELIVCNYEYAHDEFGNSICTVPRERIIKRALGLKWEEPIHEYIPLKGQLFVSDISVHHFKKGGTSERNIQILKRIVEQRPEDSRNIYYLGKELLDFGHTEEGIDKLEEFVKRSDGFWEDIYTAHFLLAKMHMEKDENKFKYHFYESMKIESRQAELYFTMGQYWERKGLFDRAVQWYEMCTVIERPKELLGTFHPEYYTWLPCLQLCVCYNNMGQMKRAYEWNNCRACKSPCQSRIRRRSEHARQQGSKAPSGPPGRYAENCL